MKCWVYPSPVHEVRECLITPENTLLGQLPPNIRGRYRSAEIWKTIDLEPGAELVALDADEALKDIDLKGYHIAGATIELIEQWPGEHGIDGAEQPPPRDK